MLILNYHRVGHPPANVRYRGMYVTPRLLGWQVWLLKQRGYEFVTVTEGVRRGSHNRFVAITFDDGYHDNLTLGLPVLNRLQVPATVYVVTGDVGKKQVIWSEAGDKVASDLMSWEELRQLEQCGWEIGSHAGDHVHLARRTREEQQQCIQTSWTQIEDALGHPPTSFAYPYGSYNQDTVVILANLNCIAAVTTRSGNKNAPTTPPLELFRQPGKGYRPHHWLSSLSLLWRS